MSASGFAVPSADMLISDGGLATELEARGNDLSDELWIMPGASCSAFCGQRDQQRSAWMLWFRTWRKAQPISWPSWCASAWPRVGWRKRCPSACSLAGMTR